MNNSTIFCGLDVDDVYFNVAVLLPGEKIPLHFRTAPSVSALLKKLSKKGIPLEQIKICYEATYLGFDIYRKLRLKGVHCDIVAPTSIPVKGNRRIKTDRLDSLKLVKYYRQGDVSLVHVPTEEDERVRDLLRSRLFLVEQIRKQKTHILSLCRRMGWDYRRATNSLGGNYWTLSHRRWLKKQIKMLGEFSPEAFNLSMLINTLEFQEGQLENYNDEIKKIALKPRYQKSVKALECFRGLDTLSALTIVIELGDINRFAHPNNCVGYVGLSIAEYSSGGKEKRFQITKTGNKFVRTIVVEACQYASKKPAVSNKLLHRRKGATPEQCRIANRCMQRLYRKSVRLFNRGKQKNKIKVACAREMIGFIWEALKKTA